jgi:predicted adenine nucleotide alpha hydrolase (AANH) superfamily ATPase
MSHYQYGYSNYAYPSSQVLFYNPNIHPKEEYDVRKDENKRYAAALGIPFVDLDYDVDTWLRRAKVAPPLHVSCRTTLKTAQPSTP